jgi:hypothetical protein
MLRSYDNTALKYFDLPTVCTGMQIEKFENPDTTHPPPQNDVGTQRL